MIFAIGTGKTDPRGGARPMEETRSAGQIRWPLAKLVREGTRGRRRVALCTMLILGVTGSSGISDTAN